MKTNLTNDVGHTRLVSEESGKVDWLGGIILREGLYLSTISLGSFLRGKAHGTVTRRRKLSVRHVYPAKGRMELKY